MNLLKLIASVFIHYCTSAAEYLGHHRSAGHGHNEYFQFCEDIGAGPEPVLPAGVPCRNSATCGYGQQGEIPMNEMEEYAQEVPGLIERANGDG
jgi:alpha-L-arabinofuranosidase